MRIARHFLKLFIGRFAWVFAFVQVFLALSSFLLISAAYPYVPPVEMLLALGDILLLLLPLTIATACLCGGLLFVEAVRRAQGFLTVELAGRDPRALALPILGFGACASLACVWLHGHVLPNAEYSLERALGSFVKSAPMMALRAVRDGGMIRGLDIRFEASDDTGVSEIAVVGPDRRTLASGRRAAFDLVDDGRMFELSLTDGRMLRVDASDRVVENIRFDRLALRFDTEKLLTPPKTELLPLKYYTDAELGRLRELASFRTHHGLRVFDRQFVRLDAVGTMRAARLAAAPLPLLVLVLVVSFLCVHVPGTGRLRAALVAGSCLLVLIPQCLVGLHLVAEDRLARSWVLFLPEVEVAAAVLAAAVLGVRGRTW